MTEIFSAQWVMPISSSPIENGAVAFDRGSITGVGLLQSLVERFPDARVTNFGKAVMLPGLVNAHSHLELTAMRGFLEPEELNFPAWLRKLTLARMSMSPEDLHVSSLCGAIEAVRAGVTCLGDASSYSAAAMKALRESGLRGIVYQESFGPDPSAAEENVEKLHRQLAESRDLETDFVRAGVSPHAVYTVSAPQLELISRLALDNKLPVMMHAAESRDEEEFIRGGSGRFAEGLKTRGINWQSPGISTIQYLTRHGIMGTQPLLAHCITVDDADIETIKQSGAGVVHCPKSNSKLGHGRAPFVSFLSAGIKTGLGSDSVASNNTCDILEEARFATLLTRVGSPAVKEGSSSSLINAEQALFAATLGGARAMGIDDQIGALEEGLQADLVVLGLEGTHQQPVRDPADALVFSSSGSDVLLTMVAGKEVYRNGQVVSVDEKELVLRLESIRTRLDSAAI